MKRLVKVVFTSLLLFSFNYEAKAQDSFFTVSGIIRDDLTRKPLEYVTITLFGYNTGTVSNSDGEFTLKIPNAAVDATFVEFSHLGYKSFLLPVKGESIVGAEILMTQFVAVLSEVLVHGFDAFYIVQEAVSKIPRNYCDTPSQMTGFYRETVQKRRNYISISEAVVDLYKTQYTEFSDLDRLQILKGRRLLSQKTSDTLAVKLVGGPNLAIFVDIVKNTDLLLDADMLSDYSYKMEEITQINGRDQYVITFLPKVVKPHPLYVGTFYIDKSSLAFTRAEFQTDMSDRNKVAEMILKKRPLGLRFRPEKVSYVISYQERGGVNYLSYISNALHFRCDWRRRFFSTNYEVVSEMVVTDVNVQNIVAFPRRDAFRQTQILTDRVIDFYDEDFWGAYNIIEPTESLETAVARLKRQQSVNSGY